MSVMHDRVCFLFLMVRAICATKIGQSFQTNQSNREYRGEKKTRVTEEPEKQPETIYRRN